MRAAKHQIQVQLIQSDRFILQALNMHNVALMVFVLAALAANLAFVMLMVPAPTEPRSSPASGAGLSFWGQWGGRHPVLDDVGSCDTVVGTPRSGNFVHFKVNKWKVVILFKPLCISQSSTCTSFLPRVKIT